eukprot:gene3897-15208_t
MTKAVTENSSKKTEPNVSKEDNASEGPQKASNGEILEELWVKEELQFNDQDKKANKLKGEIVFFLPGVNQKVPITGKRQWTNFETMLHQNRTEKFNLDKSRTDERLFLNSRSYFGHAILSKQEQMLVLEGRMQVLEEIKGNRYFVLIADEPTDVSKKEQMPITLRACTKDFVVKEYFMGIHKCEEGIAAEPFFKVVKDVLIRCGLSPKMPTGCTFDGASAMVKLGRLINEYTNGQSVYIHCLAHCNDMIIRDAIAKSSLFANATLRCQDLYALAGLEHMGFSTSHLYKISSKILDTLKILFL